MTITLRTAGRPPWLPAAVALSLFFTACGVQTWNPTIYPAGSPVPMDTGADSFLKVHMQSGELYLLESWSVPEAGGNLVGLGVHFDVERVEQATGSHSVPVAEIALLETNHQEVVSRFAFSGLVAFSTLSAVTMAICLADPKSCFGSCPTFYSVDDPDLPLAEGFSSSFARSLEERDVDWLGLRATSGPFSLVMRNEAQETHAVRHVKLLATAVPERGEVLLASDGDLVATTEARPPTRCAAGGGDCLAAVSRRDDIEYAPPTDDADLAVREEIVIDFGPVSGDVGLVLSARNSFVTTYVFYQSADSQSKCNTPACRLL